MNICAVCKTIPFTTLPLEEEPALPHHKSLNDLESSAKTCRLCLLLLRAAGELSMILNGSAINRGGFADYYGNGITHYLGRQGLGGSATTGQSYKSPPYMSPLEMFPDGDGEASEVLPWIFGNWWTFGTPEKPLQLIGMGVRLSKTPKIEDAEGNSPQVHLRGSNLRFRTDNSEYKMLR
jgi:hypothetical protein